MKSRSASILIVAILIVFGIQSCEKEGNEIKVSSYNSSDSHKAGENCMECHKSGGSGEGWFIAAGTVYDSEKDFVLPNATMRLYTGTGGTGTLIATIEGDKKGNFYTTEPIDFGSGLFPAVEGNTETMFMVSSVTDGQCNSCHGQTADRIWAK